ncbi:MAG: TonB-dependent receptor, partial [Acidobacteria bacterium]|nr:TonB-dependent receptor [Acidobacteriota bacterium]
MRALGAAVLLLAALPAAPTAAQEAVVEGVVRDATGLVLPGVTVEARSPAAGPPAATAVSDGAGRFVIAALPPGTYDVTFTLPGFETVVRRGVTAGAGSTVTLEVVLSVQLAEQVVVVGSRAQPRSVTASMVPIDAIPATEFVGLGQTDVGDQLRTLVPSYNVNPQPVGDAGRIIRPANMRGLAPDHTLVLVNGKRRHRGAIITWLGNGVADGAQGPDISTIPAIALRQVEVLRDGASAQYGSDAIAGVLNFLLKDDRSGGSVELHTGGHGAGDGGAYTVAAHAGLPGGRAGVAQRRVADGDSAPPRRSVPRGAA